MIDQKKTRIGIAFGSGSARGWAHIGIVQALAQMGIHPDIITGCSIGSIVGAAYANRRLKDLEQGVSSLSKLELMRYFEINFSLRGFVNKERLSNFFTKFMCDENQQIENLVLPYGAVATDLDTGREVWFTEGKLMDAIWSSIALPGLFAPFFFKDKWLVDGSLSNPVPVSLCRALGADIVIAVNLSSNVLRNNSNKTTISPSVPKPVDDSGNTPKITAITTPEKNGNKLVSSMAASLREYSSALLPSTSQTPPKPAPPTSPSLLDSITGSINIMQDRITRSRMAGDPPDIVLSPRVAHIGLLEFYRAVEAIEEGQNCVQRMSAEIRTLLPEAASITV